MVRISAEKLEKKYNFIPVKEKENYDKESKVRIYAKEYDNGELIICYYDIEANMMLRQIHYKPSEIEDILDSIYAIASEDDKKKFKRRGRKTPNAFVRWFNGMVASNEMNYSFRGTKRK